MESTPSKRGPLGQLLGYARKGAWTIADQGLFAGSNFVLNVLLIQSVSEESYGAYAVAFAVFLFFGTLHTGVLTEPMLVFGSGRFAGRFHGYFAFLRRGHIGFSLLSSVALGALALVAGLLGKAELGRALYAAAAALPFILFLWLARRACYVHLKPRWSAIGGLLYATVLLVGALVVGREATLTVPAVFGLMAVGSLVGAAWITLWLRRASSPDEETLSAKEVVGEHRSYGVWAVATGVLAWLPANIPFIVLDASHGAAAPGILKAVMNFIMPAAHAYAALSILLVPVFVQASRRGQFGSFVSSTAAAILAANTAYWLLLGVFGPDLIQLLYRGNYAEYAGLLWLAGLYPMVSGVAVVVRTALRAMELPRYVFWASVGSSISAATIAVLLIVRLGVTGAIIGVPLNMIVELALMYGFFRRSGVTEGLAQPTTTGTRQVLAGKR